MIIQALSFYLFAAIAIASAVLVVSLRNPVHSVLFLILTFFSAAGLFVLLGAEFLAMILVVVYVGAVAVLFMFVIMMLDINFVELRQGFLQYLPLGGTVGLIMLLELLAAVGGHIWSGGVAPAGTRPMPAPDAVTNTAALGQLIYTHYLYLFQAAGLILLVAMIGAIVLTHRRRKGVRRQVISAQMARRAEETVRLKKVETGSGA